MTIGTIIVIGMVGFVVWIVFRIITWLFKVLRQYGKYTFFDRIYVVKKVKKPKLSFIENRWLNKGLKWARVRMYHTNGMIYRQFSISEANIDKNKMFKVGNEGYYLFDEDSFIYIYPDIAYLNILLGLLNL